jgi:hypothetical protein
MLLIFAFNITPKIVLHNLIVHHKDSPIPTGKYAQICKTGFHCDCESQVVTVPYITQVLSPDLAVPVYFQVHQTRASYQFYSFPHFIFGLRGPPFSV